VVEKLERNTNDSKRVFICKDVEKKGIAAYLKTFPREFANKNKKAISLI